MIHIKNYIQDYETSKTCLTELSNSKNIFDSYLNRFTPAYRSVIFKTNLPSNFLIASTFLCSLVLISFLIEKILNTIKTKDNAKDKTHYHTNLQILIVPNIG